MHLSHCRIRPALYLPALLLLFLAGAALGESDYLDFGPFSLNTTNLSAVDDPAIIPLADHLDPCHPNPFNPQTTISYRLARPGEAHLAIYDLKGRLVQTLQADELLAAGSHQAVWNGRDRTGQTVAGGVYLCRLKVGGFSANQRMTLIK